MTAIYSRPCHETAGSRQQIFPAARTKRDHCGSDALSGPVADQAALHGLLVKVRDLGLFLISVRHLDAD